MQGSVSRPSTHAEELRQEIELTWPTLSYHFGFSPSELNTMPRWLRDSYMRELPKLLARDQLARLEAGVFPNMKPSEQRGMHRRLARQAGLNVDPQGKAPANAEEMAAQAAAHGIAIIVEPPSGE